MISHIHTSNGALVDSLPSSTLASGPAPAPPNLDPGRAGESKTWKTCSDACWERAWMRKGV
ncbi:hypothetical protein BGY98DRAFT_970578, partial [Russula aff. rugulosa BPL654]